MQQSAGGGGESIIDTKHEDHIHDVQWDYYARKLATASSDRTVKVWKVDGENEYSLSATLTGHDGPVWEVAWAHPSWGTVLASCSYDGSVIIYREEAAGRWSVAYKWSTGGGTSINSLEFCPVEHGRLMLACASSDGHFSVLSHSANNEWTCDRHAASALGCNSISWAPVDTTRGEDVPLIRLATGSCDNLVKVWRAQPNASPLVWETEPLAQDRVHKEWVRDVAFAPFNGVPVGLLASCSEDKTVYVWTRTGEDTPWIPKLMQAFESPVWRCSWSVAGTILAVSSGDDDVSLWKENITGDAWNRLEQSEE